MRNVWAFVALLLVFGGGEAFAAKRVALVIGNSSYTNVSTLANPANDAEAVGLLLRSAGFDVVQTKSNLTTVEMRKAISDFSESVRSADIAAVYYAGHGIEVDGTNYLIPVDAKLKRDVDAEDEAISLDRVLKIIEPAVRLRLVILDACRDNPFSQRMVRTISKRAIGRGFAPIEPPLSDTLIAFAAKAGSIAEDGSGTHSPFTSSLLKNLTAPGIDLRIALGRVRDDVSRATGKKQEPFVYGSLGGDHVSLLAAPEKGDFKQQAPQVEPAAVDYELASQANTKASWTSFIAKYPVGFHSDLARSRLAKLSTEPAKSEQGPAKDNKRKTESRSQLSCCLAFYAGERSLEGWGPAERCRRNMASIKMNWCAGLRQWQARR